MLKSAARRTSLRDLRELLIAFRQYPLVFLPSSILDAAAGVIGLPVVVSLYGVSAGGEFLLARQVVMTPAALICGSLGDVFHARLVPSERGDPRDLSGLVWRTAWRLLALACAVYIPVAFLAPLLAVPVFGASWSSVGLFVAILTPPTIITIAVSPVSRAMMVSRIPQIKLLADVAKLGLPVLGLIVAFHLSEGSIVKSLIAYSATTIVSDLLYFAIVLFSIRVKYQLPGMKHDIGPDIL